MFTSTAELMARRDGIIVDKRTLLRILSQRSTIVGLVGIAGGVLALVEMPISAENELKIVEGLLLFVSLVAVITKEEAPYNGTNRRTDHRSVGSGRTGSDTERKSSESQGGTKTT